MKFNHLSIVDWKQFASLDIEFHDRLTVLTGANGSGKTTILHMLARCLGWNFQELATPKKDEKTGVIKFFSNLFRRKVEENRPPVIGTLYFSDGVKSELTVPADAGAARYQIFFSNQRIIPALISFTISSVTTREEYLATILFNASSAQRKVVILRSMPGQKRTAIVFIIARSRGFKGCM